MSSLYASWEGRSLDMKRRDRGKDLHLHDQEAGNDVQHQAAIDQYDHLLEPYEAIPAAPFVILLDLNMPRMKGIEFLREMRTDPALNPHWSSFGQHRMYRPIGLAHPHRMSPAIQTDHRAGARWCAGDAGILRAPCAARLLRSGHTWHVADLQRSLETDTALYSIETEIRGKGPAQRLATRQDLSRSLVKDLCLWFEAQLKTLPAKGPTAEVIRYSLNYWAGLEQFLADGSIKIDHNTVERCMRPIKLSKKNSLFASSDEGAENWAAAASLNKPAS